MAILRTGVKPEGQRGASAGGPGLMGTILEVLFL